MALRKSSQFIGKVRPTIPLWLLWSLQVSIGGLEIYWLWFSLVQYSTGSSTHTYKHIRWHSHRRLTCLIAIIWDFSFFLADRHVLLLFYHCLFVLRRWPLVLCCTGGTSLVMIQRPLVAETNIFVYPLCWCFCTAKTIPATQGAFRSRANSTHPSAAYTLFNIVRKLTATVCAEA